MSSAFNWSRTNGTLGLVPHYRVQLSGSGENACADGLSNTAPVKWDGPVIHISPWLCNAGEIVSPLMYTHTHILTFSPHTHTYTSRWSSAGPGSLPPPTTSHWVFWWPSEGGRGAVQKRGGTVVVAEREGGGVLRAVTIYLSVCLFLLAPSPPQLSRSLQQPHTSPPPHVIPICAAKYTLPAFLPRWRLKTGKKKSRGAGGLFLVEKKENYLIWV